MRRHTPGGSWPTPNAKRPRIAARPSEDWWVVGASNARRRFDGFDIEVNPAASVASLAKKRKARRRNLNTDEIASHLKAFADLPISARLALELALYLGGQRPTQLLRVQQAYVDLASPRPELVQYDPKGRWSEPREHRLPLVGRASETVNVRPSRALRGMRLNDRDLAEAAEGRTRRHRWRVALLIVVLSLAEAP